jgi:hypothetical protein
LNFHVTLFKIQANAFCIKIRLYTTLFIRTVWRTRSRVMHNVTLGDLMHNITKGGVVCFMVVLDHLATQIKQVGKIFAWKLIQGDDTPNLWVSW